MTAHTPGRPVRAVLFDLDGTLLDSIPDLSEACHRMMVELGRAPHSIDTIRTFVGKGMLNLVRRCLEAGGGADEAGFEAAVDAFRRHYAVVNGERTEVYAGVVPALAALAGRGVAMACVTNKPAAFTGPLLARTGLAPYFAVTVSGDRITAVGNLSAAPARTALTAGPEPMWRSIAHRLRV